MDKALQREKTAERVKRYRAKQALHKPISGSVTKEGALQASVTQYPAIVYALADPIKRKKLEAIYQSLKQHRVEDKVFYGVGRNSIPFDVVGELLGATI